jgi:Na+/pantothenate symporter
MGLLWLTMLNIFAGIFIAFVVFGRPTRRIGAELDAHTFPELLGRRFNSRFIQGFSGGTIAVLMPLYAAAVLIGGARFVEVQLKLDYQVAVFVFAVVVACYVFFGGLKGVIYTDALQGSLMFVGMAVLLVALGLAGVDGLAGSTAPLADAIEKTNVQIGIYIISIGALVATFGVFLTDMLGVSRMLFAMASNEWLPRWLTAIHPTYKTPHRAILLTGALVAILAATMPLHSLVEAGSFGLLVFYGITNLSAYKLSPALRRYHRAWSGLGAILCLALALFLPGQTILVEILVIALGIAYLALIRIIRRR